MKRAPQIITIKRAQQWVLDGLNQLLPQLSSTVPPLTLNGLNQIISSENSMLLAAVANEKVLGALTLVLFTIPTGHRARIEDLVVDQSAKGCGIGRKLVRQAVDLVQNRGGGVISLTSNPNRKAANQLYQKLGFNPLETNVYFMVVPPIGILKK